MSGKGGAIEGRVEEARELLGRALQQVSRRIVGQTDMLQGMMAGLLAGGHVLLEGVPGLAKTLAVKTLAEVLDVGFKRIQFTPDLLPADLIGTMIYRPQTGDFIPRKGPVFTNIILADEINRSPAKVQSALLEAMEETQVTLGDESYPLREPFLVLATQNPIEHEGTYPLPEAQLDRFLLKLFIPYPSFEEERDILKRVGVQKPIPVQKVLDGEGIEGLRSVVRGIHVDSRIEEYIVAVVQATRERNRERAEYARFIEYGASPRASIYLYRCSKVSALLDGRTFVIPEDVKSLARPVLRHRILLTYEAEAEDLSTDHVIAEILKSVDVP